jgi:hypothetical protein
MDPHHQNPGNPTGRAIQKSIYQARKFRRVFHRPYSLRLSSCRPLVSNPNRIYLLHCPHVPGETQPSVLVTTPAVTPAAVTAAVVTAVVALGVITPTPRTLGTAVVVVIRRWLL